MERSFYLISPGDLRRKDNTLELLTLDGNGKFIPIETVYDIYCFTDITINSDCIDFLGSKGVCIHFFNFYDYYSATLYPREKLVSGKLLVQQVNYYSNNNLRCGLAKKFVIGAAENILRNLKYYNSRGKNLKSYIEKIENLIDCLPVLNDIQEIMGIEGNIRKIYYLSWNIILNSDFEFEKRVKRPPDNEINTLISFLNSVVYAKTLSEIYKTQLNPAISYLHEPSTKRFSLALDVSEIFKPLVVDRMIFKIINKKCLNEENFIKDLDFLQMKDKTVKYLLKELEETMNRTIYHRELKRNVSYKQLIRLELYKLIKHLLGDKDYQPFKIWW